MLHRETPRPVDHHGRQQSSAGGEVWQRVERVGRRDSNPRRRAQMAVLIGRLGERLGMAIHRLPGLLHPLAARAYLRQSGALAAGDRARRVAARQRAHHPGQEHCHSTGRHAGSVQPVERVVRPAADVGVEEAASRVHQRAGNPSGGGALLAARLPAESPAQTVHVRGSPGTRWQAADAQRLLQGSGRSRLRPRARRDAVLLGDSQVVVVPKVLPVRPCGQVSRQSDAPAEGVLPGGYETYQRDDHRRRGQHQGPRESRAVQAGTRRAAVAVAEPQAGRLDAVVGRFRRDLRLGSQSSRPAGRPRGSQGETACPLRELVRPSTGSTHRRRANFVRRHC